MKEFLFLFIIILVFVSGCIGDRTPTNTNISLDNLHTNSADGNFIVLTKQMNESNQTIVRVNAMNSGYVPYKNVVVNIPDQGNMKFERIPPQISFNYTVEHLDGIEAKFAVKVKGNLENTTSLHIELEYEDLNGNKLKTSVN